MERCQFELNLQSGRSQDPPVFAPSHLSRPSFHLTPKTINTHYKNHKIEFNSSSRAVHNTCKIAISKLMDDQKELKETSRNLLQKRFYNGIFSLFLKSRSPPWCAPQRVVVPRQRLVALGENTTDEKLKYDGLTKKSKSGARARARRFSRCPNFAGGNAKV